MTGEQHPRLVSRSRRVVASGMASVVFLLVSSGAALAAFGGSTSTVDSNGSVGGHSSVTIGTDGLGLISYYDTSNGNLKVAHCRNASCTASDIPVTVDASPGIVGQHSSVTIGADGFPLISYYDATNRDLKVAHCLYLTCTCATTGCTPFKVYTLDGADPNGPDVGEYTSIAVGADGLGLISYRDDSNHGLKAAHCIDINCSAATKSVLDRGTVPSGSSLTPDVGDYTALTIGGDGRGLISYYDRANGNLKTAHCVGVTCTCSTTGCTPATISTVDGTPPPNTSGSGPDVGLYTSITTGADSLGLISYHDLTNYKLKVAHCTTSVCSAVTSAAPDPALLQSGQFTSITIGADGLGLISYYDSYQFDLRVAHCNNTACSSAAAATVDSGGDGDVGYFTAVTIGADGLGLISYGDGTNLDLKVAHCSDRSCVRGHAPR
jgi:preprotein translocase subunit Sec61beta